MLHSERFLAIFLDYARKRRRLEAQRQAAVSATTGLCLGTTLPESWLSYIILTLKTYIC